ncbi:MAG: terminase [Clostridiales bacterium]|nr:terminase [Clostridiales bacterium]
MKALDVCKKNVELDTTPKYVKLQMADFIRLAEGESDKYIVSQKKVRQLETILKLLIMPKGLKAGQTIYDCATEYQWLFWTATISTVYRNNPDRRRYETGVLEISRKNFKTFTIAVMMIVFFLTEPKFSKFYSVAPDGALSREVREAMSEIIRSSPLIYDNKGTKRFRILRDYISFIPTQSQYIPLATSTSRMDGRLASVFCADEVGALTSAYPILAMRSGQLNILNKFGCIISTKYPTVNNPFEDEVAYSKRVLDGLEDDETRFSLLYEPDVTTGWETNDLILKQANPVALEIPEIWDDLIKKRAYAIAVESARENFVTKHCNVIYQGAGTETYIDTKDVQECKVADFDWRGRTVYVGMDLSLTNDNTAVAMVTVDESEDKWKIYAHVMAFIPEDRIDEKEAFEKIDYRSFIKAGNCIACGTRTIDYGAVEDYILGLEDKYGVYIQAIGYDRMNALSTVQKLDRAGYTMIDVRQHSMVLHPVEKRLKEAILNKQFGYTENKLLEINFQNARVTPDTNLNLYVHKKKSKGKVDMLFAIFNAMFPMEQDYFLNQGEFVVQVF